MDDVGELEQVYRRKRPGSGPRSPCTSAMSVSPKNWVQDTLIEALEHWRAECVPPKPGGWLGTTARRKAIDGASV